jgi:predicted cupin superfamily sugar epimerase
MRRGTFIAATPSPSRSSTRGYALVGCDVAPGFEFADFHLTTRSMLTAAYPHLGPLIARYTR